MNAPAFFPAAWKWIKPWIEAGTAEKLIFLSGEEVLATLKEHMEIDSIPKRWGGELEWSHGMLPDLEWRVKEKLGWSETQNLPVGPLKWRDEGNELAACLTGCENGVRRGGKAVADDERTVEAPLMSPEQTPGAR